VHDAKPHIAHMWLSSIAEIELCSVWGMTMSASHTESTLHETTADSKPWRRQLHKSREIAVTWRVLRQSKSFCDKCVPPLVMGDAFTACLDLINHLIKCWICCHKTGGHFHKVHKLCLKTSVVTGRFMNRFLGTLLFMVSFFTKGS